jgi:hypothetical protein
MKWQILLAFGNRPKPERVVYNAILWFVFLFLRPFLSVLSHFISYQVVPIPYDISHALPRVFASLLTCTYFLPFHVFRLFDDIHISSLCQKKPQHPSCLENSH